MKKGKHGDYFEINLKIENMPTIKRMEIRLRSVTIILQSQKYVFLALYRFIAYARPFS